MTEITVKFGEAQHTHDELKSEVDKVNQLIEQEAALIGRIAEQWDGAGRAAWEQRQREWRKEAAEEAEALSRLVAAVGNALTAMHNTEAEVARLFG